jgi:hypothetical protein
MYLSTLGSYVEAELVVKLPNRPANRLNHLGDVTGDSPAKDGYPATQHSLCGEQRDTLTDLHYESGGQKFESLRARHLLSTRYAISAVLRVPISTANSTAKVRNDLICHR